MRRYCTAAAMTGDGAADSGKRRRFAVRVWRLRVELLSGLHVSHGGFRLPICTGRKF